MKQFSKNNNGVIISDKWLGRAHYYDFFHANGKKFLLHYRKINKEQWPKNYDLYIKIQNGSLLSDEQKLENLKKTGLDNNANLIDKKWKGHKAKYCFKLSN